VFDTFHKYRTTFLLGAFNAKIGREDIFTPTIGNENLYEIDHDNGVRLVNLATSKNLTIVKEVTKTDSFMIQIQAHNSINKY
jgi:hypothetical protein